MGITLSCDSLEPEDLETVSAELVTIRLRIEHLRGGGMRVVHEAFPDSFLRFLRSLGWKAPE